jgi:ABC-type glycerol-3-phosphate transport system permease component
MGRNVATANTLIRAQRELKMVRRIVILITILTSICFPFTVFVFMGFFNHVPKYDFRISYAFVDSAGLATEIVLFQFTDPLKEAMMKIIKWRPNRIVAS